MYCSHPNCQFETFFNKIDNKTSFYYQEEYSNDIKCIFHISKKYKEKYFREIDKQLFNSILEKYLWECHKQNIKYINLSNVVFISTQIFKNNNFENKILDFTNAEFLENIRFQDIKCKELILKDCKFYDGGGIKNRNEKNSLYIEKLEFDPYLLQSDFIIDLGNYVINKQEDPHKGLVEANKTGTIKIINFSNQQVGNGKIFLVGLNKNLEDGNFTNRMLDNVIFHNSDLSKCRFLNSKVNKTTFLNISFDKTKNYFEFIISKDKIINNLYIPLLIVLLICLSYLYSLDIFDNIKIFTIFILLSILLVFPINIFIEKLLSILSIINISTFSGHHISTYDEYYLFENLKKKKESTKLNESYKNLQNLYEELSKNLKQHDKELSNEFIYSMKHTKAILREKTYDIFNNLLDFLHNFINGFGQRWIRPLFLFITTIFIFSLIFTYKITPNEYYISTYNTPSFLIGENCEFNKTTYTDKNFSEYINIKNLSNNIVYNYDSRYDFNFKKQYILCLNTNFETGFYKSLSNLFYPFTFESKKWFQNISQPAISWSFFETLLLWIFLLAFFRAIWNKIKVDS